MAIVNGSLMMNPTPLALFGFYFYTAVDLSDVGSNHIHADTTPGDICHLLGCAESGQEDHVEDFASFHRGQFGLADKTFCKRLGSDFIYRDPASIVLDADDDAVAFLTGQDAQSALAGLPLSCRSDGVSIP